MKKGFTLVELSIVLVIIGLLIGGILVGQSLVEAAKINRFISEVQQYEIASKQYKDRFKYLPGDDPNAYGYWGSDCGSDNDPDSPTWNGSNGNGNNLLSSSSYMETNSFWCHLSRSGFLGDESYNFMNVGTESSQIPGTTAPFFSIDEDLMGTGFSNNSWLYGNAPGSSGMNGIWFGGCYNGSCSPTYIESNLARSIDAKADDGLPGQGYVFGYRGSADVTAGNCVTSLSSSTGRYRGDDTGCAMIFRNLNEDVAL